MFPQARLATVFLAVAVVMAVTAALGPAPAEAAAPRFQVSGFGAYRVGGDFEAGEEDAQRSADLEEGGGWGLGLGLYRDASSWYEFLYSRQSTGFSKADAVAGSPDVTTEYFHLGGSLQFDPAAYLDSWLSLTVGVTRFTADGFSAESEFSASLGTGLAVPLGERAAVLLGVRGYLTFVDQDTRFFCSSIDGIGSCLLNSSGGTVFQAEASLGLRVDF